MKITKNSEGIKVLSDDDKFIIALPSKEIYIKPHSVIQTLVALGTTPHPNSHDFILKVTDVTTINNITFNGTTIEDFVDTILGIETGGGGGTGGTVKLFGDYINMDAEGEYQSKADFGSRKSVLFERTIVSGGSISKFVYETTVVDTADYISIWTNVGP